MKALYRKYRPISLDTVVGQDQVVVPLREALKNNKVTHAYLFSGPRGTGKTSIARIFAHELNGFKYELEDDYVDIIEIDAASNTGVDNIRDLREKAIIAAVEGKYKVYIIDEVHMLSKAAFNALLKIMEEPPEHVVFIMATTNPEKVPITITSRAQCYTFKLANPETMFGHLKKIADQEKIIISDDALKIIVERGGGSFRDTISLLDQISNLSDGKTEISAEMVDESLGLPASKKVLELLAKYADGDMSGTVEILRELLNSGVEAEALSSMLIEKISASPNSSLLNLISKLFDVQAPFAEAKLLVAFLGDGSFPTVKNPAVFSSPVSDSAPTRTLNTEPKKAESETPKNPEETIKETISAKNNNKEAIKNTETPKTENVISLNSNISTDDFLNNVATKSSMLSTILSNCNIEISSASVDIYPASKGHQKILSSKNNLTILQNSGAGKTVEIHDSSEKPKQNSAQKSTISDIMGNVQEVTDNGGDPF